MLEISRENKIFVATKRGHEMAWVMYAIRGSMHGKIGPLKIACILVK